MAVTKRPPGFGEGRGDAYFRLIWLKPRTYSSYDLLSIFHCPDGEIFQLIREVAEDRAKNPKLPVITISWIEGDGDSDYDVTIVRP